MIAVLGVNWLAVIVAAVVSLIIGNLWYSPSFFGKQWMRISGHSTKDMKKGTKGLSSDTMVKGFILLLVQAFVLAQLFGWIVVSTVVDGVIIGFWVWLGFIAVTKMMSVLHGKKTIEWFYLSSGHYLVSTLAMSIVLTTL
ncbi:MAG: DUF1761 domain-containing protein [Candidatus Diapherotrites archaeon]